MTTIGISEFARTRHTEEKPFGHYSGSWESLVQLAETHFPANKPSFRPGVVQVDVPPEGFFTSIVELNEKSVLESSWKPRAPGEAGIIQTVVKGKKSPARHVTLILYSAAALLENNGTRSTEADWEIVSINASPKEGGGEPMSPMAMARNFLEMAGGTKTEYTAQQFAEAIAYWNAHGMVG